MNGEASPQSTNPSLQQNKPQHFRQIPNELRDNPRAVELISQHQAWLQHPITQRVLELLRAKRENVLGKLLTSSVTTTESEREISDKEIRIQAIRLNEINQLQKALNDSEQFAKSVISGS